MKNTSAFTIRKKDISNPILKMNSQQRAVSLIAKYRLSSIDLSKLMMTVVLSTVEKDMFSLFPETRNKNHLLVQLDSIVKDIEETTDMMSKRCDISHISYRVRQGSHGYQVYYINDNNNIEEDEFIKPINELKLKKISSSNNGLKKSILFGIQCRVKVDDVLMGVVLTSLAHSFHNENHFKNNMNDFFIKKGIKTIGKIYNKISTIV